MFNLLLLVAESTWNSNTWRRYTIELEYDIDAGALLVPGGGKSGEELVIAAQTQQDRVYRSQATIQKKREKSLVVSLSRCKTPEEENIIHYCSFLD